MRRCCVAHYASLPATVALINNAELINHSKTREKSARENRLKQHAPAARPERTGPNATVRLPPYCRMLRPLMHAVISLVVCDKLVGDGRCLTLVIPWLVPDYDGYHRISCTHTVRISFPRSHRGVILCPTVTSNLSSGMATSA
ncbi:unnamed protein product [Arctia plantaginis]|uniref:Uncharacterized protein n=1 Tax=Arctia plantaginis TaxID=874455 RepID=A0A8S0YUY8_ARCPL|nr:unnamed protein product [Arctia plantaginis]CAB3248019.1 unnamed protein product [Arctia plantaginis]